MIINLKSYHFWAFNFIRELSSYDFPTLTFRLEWCFINNVLFDSQNPFRTCCVANDVPVLWTNGATAFVGPAQGSQMWSCLLRPGGWIVPHWPSRNTSRNIMNPSLVEHVLTMVVDWLVVFNMFFSSIWDGRLMNWFILWWAVTTYGIMNGSLVEFPSSFGCLVHGQLWPAKSGRLSSQLC